MASITLAVPMALVLKPDTLLLYVSVTTTHLISGKSIDRLHSNRWAMVTENRHSVAENDDSQYFFLNSKPFGKT